MKIVEFDYTDLKGKDSHRVLLVTGTPSNKYSGIDLTNTDEEEAGMFINEYASLQDTFNQAVENLKEKYDLKHSFRQFIDTNMKNITYDNF